MDANKPDVTPERAHASSHGVAAEPDKVSSPVILGAAFALVAFVVVSLVVVTVLFRGLDRRAEKKDDAAIASAGLERRPDRVPPLPRLQVYPARHWKDFRAAEAERLATYGWMDRATGAVHVPIERAMDLIAVRGVGPLPAAPVAMPGEVPTPQATPAAAKAEKKR